MVRVDELVGGQMDGRMGKLMDGGREDGRADGK